MNDWVFNGWQTGIIRLMPVHERARGYSCVRMYHQIKYWIFLHFAMEQKYGKVHSQKSNYISLFPFLVSHSIFRCFACVLHYVYVYGVRYGQRDHIMPVESNVGY